MSCIFQGQYRYLHEALLEALQSNEVLVKKDEFHEYYKSVMEYALGSTERKLDSQFKVYSHIYFYVPGLKGPPGASSNWIVRLSACLSVLLSACLSVIPSRLQTKCNIYSLGDDTVTKLGLSIHLWVPHTSLTSHAPGAGTGSKCRTDNFAIFWLCCRRGIRVSQTHV